MATIFVIRNENIWNNKQQEVVDCRVYDTVQESLTNSKRKQPKNKCQPVTVIKEPSKLV